MEESRWEGQNFSEVVAPQEEEEKGYITKYKPIFLICIIWERKNVRFLLKNVNVKWTLVQTLMLCTGRTAHRGSRGIALLFHEQDTRRERGVSVTPMPLFTSGKTRYPTYRRLGGSQGRSGQVRKISPPTGIRSPDGPALSQSLCRLSYPVHVFFLIP